jgi:hypothetical protein
MATYKLELGPKDANQPGWDVFVAAGADTLPGTGTSLGTVDHAAATDPLDKYAGNHVAFHHVQEIVYKRLYPTGAAGAHPFWPYGFHDMSVIRIRRHGALMNATALTAAALSVVIAATATIVLKYDPGQVAAANADHDFQSQNTAIATVSAVGVVTGVAVGSTVVRVTNKFNGLVVDVPVTVTATE